MHSRHDSRWAYLLVIVATLFWAGNVVLGRALRQEIGPFTLAAARMGIAGVAFLPLLLRRPTAEHRPGKEWPSLLGMALLGMVGCPVTLYLALRYTTATSTSLINGTGPLMTALLAAWLLRDRLTPGQLAGALVSLLGVTLVVGGGRPTGLDGLALNRGDLIMLLNVAMWGLYSIMSRVATRDRSAVWATTFSTWFALPFLIPAAVLEWRQAPPTLSGPVLLGVLYIGVFATCLAFLAWNEGVRRVGPAGAMAFYNMLPVFGALLAALFLGERLVLSQILGGGLIIAGGLLAALWPSRSGRGHPAQPPHALRGG